MGRVYTIAEKKKSSYPLNVAYTHQLRKIMTRMTPSGVVTPRLFEHLHAYHDFQAINTSLSSVFFRIIPHMFHDFPMIFPYFPIFSHIFPMIFPYFSMPKTWPDRCQNLHLRWLRQRSHCALAQQEFGARRSQEWAPHGKS